LAAFVLLAASAPSCKKSVPQSAAEAHRALHRAASGNDAVAVYHLLDRKTQWSIISAYKSKREIRQLVLKHYPAQRRDRELQRTQLVQRAGNAVAYFLALAERDKLLAPLAAAGTIDAEEKRADEATLQSGGTKLRFCKGDAGWSYCGLREYAEGLKVRASRDLALVKENVETFGRKK
jgi:hypothetical protein